jgi:hypothetical protein
VRVEGAEARWPGNEGGTLLEVVKPSAGIVAVELETIGGFIRDDGYGGAVTGRTELPTPLDSAAKAARLPPLVVQRRPDHLPPRRRLFLFRRAQAQMVQDAPAGRSASAD